VCHFILRDAALLKKLHQTRNWQKNYNMILKSGIRKRPGSIHSHSKNLVDELSTRQADHKTIQQISVSLLAVVLSQIVPSHKKCRRSVMPILPNQALYKYWHNDWRKFGVKIKNQQLNIIIKNGKNYWN
jgi:hypothetical protein